MDSRSWWMPIEDAPQYRLPDDLRARDALHGRDCGWVEQMRPFVRQFSQPGDIVFDPFCGFGTTLLAAALEGRNGLGFEIDPARAVLARERLLRHGIAMPVIDGTLPQTLVPKKISAHTSAHAAQDHRQDTPQSITLCLTNVPYFGCCPDAAGPQEQLYRASTFADYLQRLREVFYAVRHALSEGGYCIVMVQNITLGERVLPLAWEVARILESLFVACEERVLCYPPRELAQSNDATRTDRSHEYALVFRKQRITIDIVRSRDAVRALREAGFAFDVHGSFKAWQFEGQPHDTSLSSAPLPGDVDLCVPADPAQLQAMLGWLSMHGYRLQLWGESVLPDVSIASIIAAHYLRAERIDADGRCVRFDIAIASDA